MKTIAGVDEVGRGSLIGPVYAAAVILNKSINKKLLKDSKSLRKNKREFLAKYIKKNSIWATGKASVSEIEKINILHASLLAMERAIKKLKNLHLIFVLICFQGFLGWYMVKSGLVNNIDVSHFRLSFHLLFAFIILSLIGGSVLSTTSGLKFLRIYILIKAFFMEIYKLVKPNVMLNTKIMFSEKKINTEN